MGREQLNKFARRIKQVMTPAVVNELGRSARFCRRERVITPYRLALSLVASCATMRVESLADIQRSFNALFGTSVAYKPFHNQLAKWHFRDFMRALVSMILAQWVVRVLSARSHGAFSEFARIVIQDGSSFAIKDALREHYPGRFTSKGPAAVELHATMSLLDESLCSVTLTPDTFSERAQLPAAHELCGDLLLADRGYFSIDYMRALEQNGAHFVIRGYTSINPTVREAFFADGTPFKRVRNKPLKACRFPKKGTLDLDVQWGSGEQAFHARLLVSWNTREHCYRFLVTNLARAQYTPEQIGQAYRLRWQIELLFKEWKSYANLHAFDTRNPSIVEGLIWAAIAAAAMKRFIAHITQVLHGVEISTRKVAMCAHHVLTDIFRALADGHRPGLNHALRTATEYLSKNAARAHPNRDRRSGRLQFGLEPVLQVA